EGDLREGNRWRKLQEHANSLLDKKSPGDWNQAMMELGAMLCIPRSPQCMLCPVSEFCEARKIGIAESLPAIRKKRDVVEVSLASAVFVDVRGCTLLLAPPKRSQREQHDDIAALVSEMWHFPTIAARTKPANALRNHVASLLGAANNGNLLFERQRPVCHTVTYRALTLQSYRVPVSHLPHLPGAKTVSLSEVAAPSSLPVSNLTRKVARAAMAFT